MEFVLRCNDLRCRAQLHDQAVVTTCSHVFCAKCADTTGLSSSSNANRLCPACGTQLTNPDDAVVSGLNPSEDYKTSVLSGLSPTIIMECASRGLAFYSYQASQEIIYQEHLAKSLTEKYGNLSQHMDQLIHDANSQIQLLQDKIQAIQAEQGSLEKKNYELLVAFKEKSRSLQQVQKLYQSLKAQVMASHVANAAGDEVDYALQHTARGDRFVDRLPGTRAGMANNSHSGAGQQHRQGMEQYGRHGSGSSGSNGQQRGGVGLGSWNAQLQGRTLGGRGHTGNSAPVGTPTLSQNHRSRLPVLGSARQDALLNPTNDSSYQASPIMRQPVVGGAGPQNVGGFGFGGKVSKRTTGGTGPLGR